MGVRAGPGRGEELHRQDELLAWHRLPRHVTPPTPQRSSMQLSTSPFPLRPCRRRRLPSLRPASRSPPWWLHRLHNLSPPPPTRTAPHPPRPAGPPPSVPQRVKTPSSISSHSSSKRDSR